MHLQAVPKSSRRKPCPPHGVIVVESSFEGYYMASCLVCGLEGPTREDALRAKLAFDLCDVTRGKGQKPLRAPSRLSQGQGTW
jgi:hypothetical protein